MDHRDAERVGGFVIVADRAQRQADAGPEQEPHHARRQRDRAVLHPEPRCAARVIAGHAVHALSQLNWALMQAIDIREGG